MNLPQYQIRDVLIIYGGIILILALEHFGMYLRNKRGKWR